MTEPVQPDREGKASSRRLVWILVGVMALSFTFGIAMFLPAEHRAYKLVETLAKYQARRPPE